MSDEIIRLIDATWPAAEWIQVGPFTLRRGEGGGKRVSAATAPGPVTEDEITAAEQAMDDRGQQAMFAVRADQVEFDRMLADRTYLMLDPTRLYRARIDDLADLDTPPNLGFSVWPPLQVQKDIWAAGQTGPARLAIMRRVTGPKTTILGRSRDKPAGTAFVAFHEGIATIHAMDVLPDLRRQGVARTILVHAARWGRDNGADRLVALITNANIGSCRLFENLGFTGAEAYHYRIRP